MTSPTACFGSWQTSPPPPTLPSSSLQCWTTYCFSPRPAKPQSQSRDGRSPRCNCAAPALAQDKVKSRCDLTARPKAASIGRSQCGDITAALALSVRKGQVRRPHTPSSWHEGRPLQESGEAAPRGACQRRDGPVPGRLLGWSSRVVCWCPPGRCPASGGSGGQPFTLAHPPFKECSAILRA